MICTNITILRIPDITIHSCIIYIESPFFEMFMGFLNKLDLSKTMSMELEKDLRSFDVGIFGRIFTQAIL